ncbi:hypothetical protein G4O51_01020 [Candidatus Bathyarchaeota archaeon A05DMB-2]|jgi:hypothetical protein|nr:hypothetical protein [Candidatus Bathyarchaeota archaeon A05DMB-2]
MAHNPAEKSTSRIKRYITENWGAPFIIGSVSLLIIAAALMTMSLTTLSNEAAVYAYFSLILGVAGQLIRYLKFNKKTGDNDNEPS